MNRRSFFITLLTVSLALRLKPQVKWKSKLWTIPQRKVMGKVYFTKEYLEHQRNLTFYQGKQWIFTGKEL